MSDLEDLDHEPDMPIEEGPAAPANNQATGEPAEGFLGKLKAADRGALLKAAVVLVVVVGGGAYFMMSSHHGASKRAGASYPPQRAAMNQMDRMSPPPVSPPMMSAPPPGAAPAEIISKQHELLPAAIPPMEPGNTAAAMTPPTSPPIVNEMPPSSAQLTNAGGTVSPSPAAPAGIPGMPPSAMPSMPASPPSAFPSQGASAGPSFIPTTTDFTQPQAQPQPGKAPPVVKNEMPMPSAIVPPVNEVGINKTGMNAAPSPSPAAVPVEPKVEDQTAKVEELQKKIDDLEKTISQLQQAAVEKPAQEAAAQEDNAPVQQPVHHKAQRTAASHHRHKARQAVAVKWVLKAAKPGVAWVAPKGSQELQMVEIGDSLRGIGSVTAITRDASGNWMVEGTKGKITQ